MSVSLTKNTERVHPSKRYPENGALVWMVQCGTLIEGTLLQRDESGEFGLIWWHESGVRMWNWLHYGYDEQLQETMEWM